jgi:hypothetical protein
MGHALRHGKYGNVEKCDLMRKMVNRRGWKMAVRYYGWKVQGLQNLPVTADAEW